MSTVVKVEPMEVKSLNEVTTSLRLETCQLRIDQLSTRTHAHALCITWVTRWHCLLNPCNGYEDLFAFSVHLLSDVI